MQHIVRLARTDSVASKMDSFFAKFIDKPAPFITGMRTMIVLVLSMGLPGCAAITARGMSDPELKARFADIEHELAGFRAEEADSAQMRRFEKVSAEGAAVEYELLRRCQAGDHDACLRRFTMLRE